ncbi:hypothetical protein [Lederbergia ruris]|uniref:hypothetical protein n=1 Tax=Lederbergia ruris TaxID=217495 RepID=UPI001BB39311|nr:hypothetical protein [Lederbergia ruris]
MWKWILLILAPFVMLAIFEEVINYIVYRLTGTRREKKSVTKKAPKNSKSKQQSHSS